MAQAVSCYSPRQSSVRPSLLILVMTRKPLKDTTWILTDTPPAHLRKELLWCERNKPAKRQGK